MGEQYVKCGNCRHWTGPEQRECTERRVLYIRKDLLGKTRNRMVPVSERVTVQYTAGDCLKITDQRDAETYEYCGRLCDQFECRCLEDHATPPGGDRDG